MFCRVAPLIMERNTWWSVNVVSCTHVNIYIKAVGNPTKTFVGTYILHINISERLCYFCYFSSSWRYLSQYIPHNSYCLLYKYSSIVLVWHRNAIQSLNLFIGINSYFFVKPSILDLLPIVYETRNMVIWQPILFNNGMSPLFWLHWMLHNSGWYQSAGTTWLVPLSWVPLVGTTRLVPLA